MVTSTYYSGTADIEITGGTYAFNPSDYLAEGYTAAQITENMWVVSAE